MIEIAKVVAGFGGMHISHMRDEAAGVLDSVRETIRIGEEGGLPTQITHHKIIGATNWGKSVETLRLVEEARARGWTSPSTSIHTRRRAPVPARCSRNGRWRAARRRCWNGWPRPIARANQD